MGVVFVVTESCVMLMLLLLLIDIGVVVTLNDSFVTSMLIGPLVSLVLSRDTLHRSMIF